MSRSVCVCATIGAMGALVAAGEARAVMITPDSATAMSTFNANYDIGNAIDGSGLPAGFTPADSHADYAAGNHWTTATGAVAAGTAKASLFFDNPTDIGGLYLWNHRSNVISVNPDYDVRGFDLIFRDGAGVEIGSALGLEAQENIASGQTFVFPIVSGVRQVDFIINSTWGSTTYTGFAEIRFDTVPAPGTIAVGVLGLVAGVRRRR